MSWVSKGVRAGAAALIVFGLAGRAAAATRIWTGAGGNASTATAANWQGNALPQDGDDVIFPSGAAQLTLVQALAINFHSVNFTATGGTKYVVSGNFSIIDHIKVDFGEADLLGAVVLVQSGNTPADITFTAQASSELVLSGSLVGFALATVHIAGPGRVTFAETGAYVGATMIDSGTLRLQSDTALGSSLGLQAYVNPGAILELDDANGTVDHAIQFSDGTMLLVTSSTTLSNFVTLMGNTQITVAPGKNLVFGGQVSGDGTFSKDGTGDLRFAATVDNTFGQVSGAPDITAGTMHLSQTDPSQAHVALPFGLQIENNTQVSYTADNQIEGQVILNGGGHLLVQGFTDAIQSLDGPAGGSVDLAGGTFTVSGGQFSGAITGTGSFKVAGGVSLKLNGTSTFTGTTTVTGENLIVNGTLPGPIVLANGGLLSGTGTVGTVTTNNGIVSPGIQGGGTLHTHSLTLANGTYALNAFPSAGSTVFSQTAVIGTVTLGAAFDHSGFTAGATVPSTPIVIIDNDGTDPVVGTFAGLPEGAGFVQGGFTYTISYHGGDGNDVVLMASPGSTLPPLTYYLSEGSTGGFFTTDILIANPNNADAPITMTFYTQSNGVVTKDLTVPALQRTTVTLNTLSEVGDGAVSTIVSSNSGVPLVVERTMTWDRSGYGSSGDKSVSGPSTTWYFAEGSQGFFSTYILLANPQSTANTATITYFHEGDVPLTRTYQLLPQSRTTVDLGADASLVDRSFGFQVQFAQPGVAERSMYFGTSPFWSGGHESAGVTAPVADWLLAEGATGPFFETFILLANPNSTDAQATVTFLPSSGSPVVKTKTVPANGRLTINIEPEDPALANAAVATQVHATLPIVAERSQYWPDPAPQWYEAHNSFGVTAPGTKWGLAEGRVGQTAVYQSYILLANPGTTAANVTIVFLREHGGAPLTKTFTVDPTSRRNIAIAGPGSDVPELVDENFGAIISSDQPIAVERSMYSNALGQIWAAGTNATGSPLP